MKFVQKETEYGPISFRDYGYKDLLPYDAIHMLTKEQVFEHINPYSVKNSIKKAQYRTGKYLYQLMWKVIIDHAMAGDIIELPYGGKIYIGVIDKTSSKHANLHTYGKVYGLKMILNSPHTYRFKMRTHRKTELMKNLRKGQNYHNY
jgi:hypothetical protein